MANPVVRTLDIPQTQIVVHYGPQADADCPYHHRVLLFRVSGSQWVILTPDHDRYVEDLEELEYTVVRRNTAFPDHCITEGLYHFDPLDQALLRLQIRSAKEEAHLQSGEGGTTDVSAVWRFCDPNLAKFGEVVDSELVEDANVFTELQGHGIVLVSGVAYRCQLIEADELDKLKKNAVADHHNSRLLPGARTSHPSTLLSYLKVVLEIERPEWRYEGSRVSREWLLGLANGPSTFTSYHAEWIRMSGVAEGCAQAHEHRQICECLRMALFEDALDIQNLSCFEQLIRRVFQVEMAVDKNPRHPDFTGLGILVDGTTTSGGASRVPKFTSWVTARQKEQAEIYKQRRLFTEEQSKATAEPKAAAQPKAAKKAPRPKA